MNECVCAGSGETRVGFITRKWKAVKRWMFLNIWCRHFYRPVMRFAHRYNWHYAPVSSMSPEYGKRDHWCQWCGLRGTTLKIDPNEPLFRKNV